MKFVTFNIRCDFGQDGANNFIYRRPLILEKIRQEKPDIIGFQEVLPHVAAWLKENLTEYYIAGCGREKDLTGEAMIIAYRKERFQSVSLETFWLSPTPYVPGSRYPVQSMCRVLRRMWYLRIWRPEKCSASSTPIWITSAPGRESLAWSRFSHI